jgi:hypothetical protein
MQPMPVVGRLLGEEGSPSEGEAEHVVEVPRSQLEEEQD